MLENGGYTPGETSLVEAGKFQESKETAYDSTLDFFLEGFWVMMSIWDPKRRGSCWDRTP